MHATVDPRLGQHAERFAVDMFSGCWRYQGRLDLDGYGVLYANSRSYRAHRYVYTVLVGEIPTGADGRSLTLDHVRERGCLYRDCCNPAHLEPVTQTENSKRVVPWNRLKTLAHAVITMPKPASTGSARTAMSGGTARHVRRCDGHDKGIR